MTNVDRATLVNAVCDLFDAHVVTTHEGFILVDEGSLAWRISDVLLELGKLRVVSDTGRMRKLEWVMP